MNISSTDAIEDKNTELAIAALAVIREHIRKMDAEDREDLRTLFLILMSSDDEEEIAEAVDAVNEIMHQGRARIQPVDAASGERSKWAEYVGGLIRKEREKQDLNQQQLADKAGLQQAHISKIENGVHSPNRKTLEKIASALGLPVCHFDPNEEK